MPSNIAAPTVVSGGWSAPVHILKARDPKTMKVDVDRLGVVALDAITQVLELLPLRRLDVKKQPNAKPEVLLFQCSHGVSRANPVTPTFPSRDAGDKRLRIAERLLAGEQLVRALVRHVAVNDDLRTIEVTHAPLRLFDWQGLFSGLRTNGCPLQALNLAGSRLGDAGMSTLGPAVLAHPTLRSLNLDGCGLTSASSDWLVRLLQDSNNRQNRGRARSDMRKWAKGLRHHVASVSFASPPPGRPLEEEEDDDEELIDLFEGGGGVDGGDGGGDGGKKPSGPAVGIVKLSLAGNDLGERGGVALGNHLLLDRWLEELDLRRNGIGPEGLGLLREAAEQRETAETEKLLLVPPLQLRLEGNIEERVSAATTSYAKAKSKPTHIPHSAFRPQTAYHAVRGHTVTPRRRPRSAREQERMVLQVEARRLRKQYAIKRIAAGQARAAVELNAQIERGARAAALAPKGQEPPLSAADWSGLADASGGADVLLDAMEGLVAVALQRAAASRKRT